MHMLIPVRSVKGNQKTVLCSLLENATNGDAVVKRKLDECVSDTSDAAGAGLIRADDNDPDYALIVDFNVLKVSRQTCFLFALAGFI